MLFNPTEYTTVFLSFDEPNADTNYQHLLTLCPGALRVHGVKGSDTAHKAVAQISQTKNVIIVDADNFVKPDFYSQTYEIGNTDLTSTVLSFTAHNKINGQQYGNGGIKVWPVELLKSMKTHENSDNASTLVDFDFSNYKQMNYVASEVRYASHRQAWRAGFREGVKLMLDNGQYQRDIHNIDWRNYDRLWNWMHIGSDVEHGYWAIHGARFGCWNAVRKFDLSKLHNFEYLDYLFDLFKDTNFVDGCEQFGHHIQTLTNDRRIGTVYSPRLSKEYRESVKPCLRMPNDEPYDIVFISYNELNADKNYRELIKRFPRAKRIDGVQGIHNAHIEAAKLCSTDYFWVVDGDAEIVPEFNFDYVVPFYDTLKVRVWRAENPVNGLTYGYGGVKLLPRIATVRMRTDRPDMTTSICKDYEPIFVVSNITRFDTDPFNTWRSAFRECTKLASQVIDNSYESIERLDIWCSVGDNDYAIDGAKAGREYGTYNKDNLTALRKINDFMWMREQYDRFYKNTL
jgi:cellulose synthase/poly-beta-1,6-N-acetylglucosamine synthase-like glycosyltransferase